MIQRTAIENLTKWKNATDRHPLIIRGARQVGKTTLINQFSEQFDCYLHLNLDKEKDKRLFSEDDTLVLIDKIFVHCGKRKVDGDTLLFIDEIQNSPEAVKQLRYFYEDSPWLYVIAAGSLLETLIDTHTSFPVGRVDYMALRPCSFSEFLNGTGEDYDAEVLANFKGDYIHERMMNHFLNYILVGGMPEAIVRYADKYDILAVTNIYSKYRTSYSDDVEKYSKNDSMKAVIRHVIGKGWAFAAEPISFNNFAESNYRSREMSEALRTLEKALLLELAYPVVSEQIPMIPILRRKPKLFWLDTGLVNYFAGVRKQIFNVQEIMSAWKGRIAEHIVAQELIAENFEFGVGRHYWARDKEGSSAKIDFVHQHDSRIIPIEVKSGINSHLRSLHQFMDLAPHDVAVRVWTNPYSIDEVSTPKGKRFRLVNIPFYYVSQLDKILDRIG